MLSHYLRDGLRNAKRSPAATAINVFCLALGLMAFVISYGIVSYWKGSDSHFKNAAGTYVITTETVGVTPAHTWSAEHLAKYLRADYPELEIVARARSMGETAVVTGERKLYTQGAVADPGFLHIFDFPFSAGDPATALSAPRSAIVSMALATQLFGTDSALGKTLLLDGRTEVTVTGVFQRDSRATHHNEGEWRFDLYASWDVHEAYMRTVNPKWDEMPEIWSNQTAKTYVLFPQSAWQSAGTWVESLKEFGPRHIPEDQLGITDIRISAIPVTKVRLSDLNELLFSGRTVLSVTFVLMTLGFLVLVIACVSYANLAAAQNTARAKEIGTRKVLGATAVQLAKQQFVETSMQIGVAIFLAAMLIVMAVPAVNRGFDLNLGWSVLEGAVPAVILAAVVVTLGLGAAIYPSLRLAGVSPMRALESGKSVPQQRVVSALLVSVQFFVASFFLIALIVMQLQASELREKVLGSTQDSEVLVGPSLNDARILFATFKAAFSEIPSIASVASVGMRPYGGGRSLTDLSRSETSEMSSRAFVNQVSEGFFETLDMRIVAGRDFASDRRDQSSTDAREWDPVTPASAIIDQRLATDLGFSSAEAAVGELVHLRLPFADRPTQAVQVIGVVESRPLTFSSYGVTGNAYQLTTRAPAVPLVRVRAGEEVQALREMERVWNSLAPAAPFRFLPLEQLFDYGYRTYDQAYSLMTMLVMLAFGIAVTSLFAMAVEVMGRTSYEVGVRKTLGATTRLMLGRLTWNLLRPVFFANLLAWPLAYLAGRAYLGIFMHRIEISLWPFLAGLIITSAVGCIAVGYQTLRTARLNPATVLRYE